MATKAEKIDRLIRSAKELDTVAHTGRGWPGRGLPDRGETVKLGRAFDGTEYEGLTGKVTGPRGDVEAAVEAAVKAEQIVVVDFHEPPSGRRQHFAVRTEYLA